MIIGTPMSVTASSDRGNRNPKSAAAPLVAGPLPDLDLTAGVPMALADLSAGFSGSKISYALAPGSAALPEGLVLQASGRLEGTPAAPAGPLAIIVRASNTAGHADNGFQLNVAAMAFQAALSGLTALPEHGGAALSGTTVAATVDIADAPATYRWATVEDGPIAGATDATFVPDADQLDGRTLYCTVTVAPHGSCDTDAATVRHVPPVVAAPLEDEVLDVGTGSVTVDAATAFTGRALRFAASGPDVSVDPATGLLTIATDAPVPGDLVTVTATNSGGSARTQFVLTVEGAEFWPDLSMPVVDEITDTITISLDADATVYWRRDPLGTNAGAAQIIAGGGTDSGSFAATAGTSTVDIAFASGMDGLQELSLVAAADPYAPSVVRRVAIDIDTTVPEVTAIVPAAGATPATGADIVIDLSEAVDARGRATLLADGTAVEVFDLATGSGDAGGSALLTAARLTLRPAAPMAAGKVHGVRLTGLADPAGNVMAEVTVPQPGFVPTAAVTEGTGDGSTIAHVPQSTLIHRSGPLSSTATPGSFTAEIGAADADRWIVLAVGGLGHTADITGITLDGLAFVKVRGQYPGGLKGFAQIWVSSAKVPTGTSGTLAFTTSGTLYNFAAEVYRLVKSGDATTPMDTEIVSDYTGGQVDQSLSLNTAADGAMVAVAQVNGATGSPNPYFLPDIETPGVQRDLRGAEVFTAGSVATAAATPRTQAVGGGGAGNFLNAVAASWS